MEKKDIVKRRKRTPGKRNTKEASTEGPREEDGVRHTDSNTAKYLRTGDH